MIILGIDPGTVRVGYGVIEVTGRALKILDCGVIGDKNRGAAERLAYIGNEVRALIKKCRPDIIGVEQIYFSKNKKTAISVAEARGVIVFVAKSMEIPILEFTPSDIKSVVAGDGRCDKKSLRKMVAITLGVEKIDGPDDVSDALAIAIRASFENPK